MHADAVDSVMSRINFHHDTGLAALNKTLASKFIADAVPIRVSASAELQRVSASAELHPREMGHTAQLIKAEDSLDRVTGWYFPKSGHLARTQG